ncbi:alpha/beta hydrolase [Paractinoplanes rishiriensis]|nr:alpha/beta hydrolase [Actinoplanes rishiriensis]
MVRSVGLLPALVWGVLAGFLRPRGPIFPLEAVGIIVVSVVVGVVAGRVTRSRWAMFFAPIFFVVAGEVTRIGFTGPTVDLPRLSTLGQAALVSGRGAYALLTVLPMVVGAAYGAGSTRRSRSWLRWVGRFCTGILALVVAAITVVVAVPGRAAPIGGGISELAYAGKLGLMIRGNRADAPLLLFVPGSPGGSELGAMRRRLGALEQQFVVATMDRRGGGRSFGGLDPTPTFTVENETANVVQAAKYLLSRFRKDKLYLVAHSGGTIGATLAVQDQPALFAAYVGVGQVAAPAASDRGQYDDTLARAREKGDDALVNRLTAVGPPPYDDIYGYEPMILAEDVVYGSGNGAALEDNVEAPELSALDKVHVISGLLDSFDAYYPRVQEIDFRNQVPALGVPVWFVAGEREVPARTRDLNQWFQVLQAPRKEVVTLAGAGHRSMFDQPAAFVELMSRVVVAAP